MKVLFIFILIFAVVAAGLVMGAVAFFKGSENFYEQTEREFKQACTSVNGKAVWNRKHWECLK